MRSDCAFGEPVLGLLSLARRTRGVFSAIVVAASLLVTTSCGEAEHSDPRSKLHRDMTNALANLLQLLQDYEPGSSVQTATMAPVSLNEWLGNEPSKKDAERRTSEQAIEFEVIVPNSFAVFDAAEAVQKCFEEVPGSLSLQESEGFYDWARAVSRDVKHFQKEILQETTRLSKGIREGSIRERKKPQAEDFVPPDSAFLRDEISAGMKGGTGWTDDGKLYFRRDESAMVIDVLMSIDIDCWLRDNRAILGGGH